MASRIQGHDSPTVSVVMAVKNAARHLEDALDSVDAQTRPPLEVVIVDGHSTDETEQIARAHARVRWMTESATHTPSYAAAWNDGIRAARGDLIALLDSDDLWTNQKLEWQVAALATSGARCVIGHVEFFRDAAAALPPAFKPALLDRSHVAYMPGALLAHRSLFERIGPFDTNMTIANDIDWFARLKDSREPIAIVPHVVIRKRVHEGNLSYCAAQSPSINREMLHALRASIHRQRAST